MIYIPTSEIKQPQLHADTLGFTFVWKGHFLRGIYPQSEALAKSYFETGFLNEVVSRGYFPKTWISEYENEQFCMIVEHDLIQPILFATEWNSAMLKDAALMVIDLAEIGWKYGYNMVDCHKLNVLFSYNKPLYVDLGSFVLKENGSTGWRPYKGYLESYVYILDMWTNGCGQIAKRMMSPGVYLRTEDYMSWKQPIYRRLPGLKAHRIKIRRNINRLAIMADGKRNGVKGFAKRVVDIFKPAISQHFSKLQRYISRCKVIYAPISKGKVADVRMISDYSSITCINITSLRIINTLLQNGIKRVISLNEDDSVSNTEYRELKNITSVSYHLLNGGVLVRDNYPEMRLQSEVVLAYCTDGGHGEFFLHNSIVYLEQCMAYSTTGTMYVLLPYSNQGMLDLLREKWKLERLSDDGKLIEVKSLA